MNKVIAAMMMMAITTTMPAMAGNKHHNDRNNKKTTVVVVTNDKKASHFDNVDKRTSHFDAHKHAYRPDVKTCTFRVSRHDSHKQVVAKVEDGILTITMPKTEPKEKVTKAIEVS